MKSPYITIPHLIRGYSPLVLPGTNNPRALYTMADLRKYDYRYWAAGERYFVNTGWGQDAGWTVFEEDAAQFCKMMRESIRFSAVVVCESLPVGWGTECDIIDINRHWNSDVRLSYKGYQFWAMRSQWRFKVSLDTKYNM